MITLCNLAQIWYGGSEGGGHLRWFQFKKGAWSYVCVKIVYSFFLLIYSRSLLEVSKFTTVVYPQYMEQLIVCYFSSFSVNPHSLMFY